MPSGNNSFLEFREAESIKCGLIVFYYIREALNKSAKLRTLAEQGEGKSYWMVVMSEPASMIGVSELK